jgi:hypothetical protein
MVTQSKPGGQARHWARPDAGAVWLADRYAACSQPERWIVGGSFRLAKQEYFPANSVLSSTDFGGAAWLYQEDAENADRGLGFGEAKNEGGYKMTKRNKHIGSSLDDFLKEDGILEETRAVAL